MGATTSSASSTSRSGNHSVDSGGNAAVDGNGQQSAPLNLKLEDLELPPKRDRVPLAPSMAAAVAAQQQQQQQSSNAGGGTGGLASVTEEIFRGGEPLGQRAFEEDGLVGTESQQLSLLAHYAELCHDFRHYQKFTRSEGTPRETSQDGAQLLLLHGPPGTGKTQHAVSFARALGLPLLLANPTTGTNGGRANGWSARLRKEVNGRDCVVFFDEVDQHAEDSAFASELRQFIDGVCQPTESNVLLVGTSNCVDRLPEDVLHRAEIIEFERPQEMHLTKMWQGYAAHLRESEVAELASVSAQNGITGRDVRHCASWAERHMAIQYLNKHGSQGYCHGAALASCPLPPLNQYVRCVQGRSANKKQLGPLSRFVGGTT